MQIIKTHYSVRIGGNDITGQISRYCTSISINKSAGQASDTASLTFSDPDGSIFIPQEENRLEISVKNIIAFRGFVDDVDYDFEDGRSLIIGGNSLNNLSKAKEPDLKSKDDSSFSQVAKEWGQSAGLDVSVSGSISSLKRAYWIMQNESFMSWGEAIANEIGATFKVIGNQAFFVGRNEGLSASGRPLTPIYAVYGGNLKGGRISPIVARPKYAETGSRYFDQKLGEYVTESVKTSAKNATAKWFQGFATSSKERAEQLNESNSKSVDRETGDGEIKILGDATAEPEAKIIVSGIRPGIDGSYRINALNHTLDSSGFITKINLKHPSDGAGVDSR